MYIKLPKNKNVAKMESTTIKRVFIITNLFLQNRIEQTRKLRMQLDLFKNACITIQLISESTIANII